MLCNNNKEPTADRQAEHNAHLNGGGRKSKMQNFSEQEQTNRLITREHTSQDNRHHNKEQLKQFDEH